MYEVYAAAARQVDLPQALLPAQLLFGFFAVAVEMPFAVGCQPTPEELESDTVLRPIAEAIAWLMRKRLVYVDVRSPNIILSRPHGDPAAAVRRVRLVDYDDCVLLDAGVASRAAADGSSKVCARLVRCSARLH